MGQDTGADSRIGIRMLDSVADAFQASAVLSAVWGGDRTGMPPNLVRALAHAGNYTAGLFDGDRMIGASVAFFGPPGERTMHSHITGILPEHRGRGLGRRMKSHQSDWAVEHGVDRITWTFDPLVARNAHFNLTVLGAHAVEYLENHYGAMDDGVNRADESDRLLVEWDLLRPPPVASAPGDADAAVAVPEDIETLRAQHPAEAVRWRRTVRRELAGRMGAGMRIVGFDSRAGYLLVRA
jgi:predicted GNAT superfamily acetyltransferase